jgi:hypothetical protein
LSFVYEASSSTHCISFFNPHPSLIHAHQYLIQTLHLSEMAPESSSLGCLPVEILGLIFRLLDPIGLVSISQTSFHFRRVVQPKRTHFLERLLELECREDTGGITPVFRSRDNYLEPSFTAKEWHAMHWACGVCLKLLPHTAFNLHYILRLQYRKPLPGSPAAESYTSWEPTRDVRYRKRVQEQQHGLNEYRQIRRRYDLSCKSNDLQEGQTRDLRERLAAFQNSGMVTFQGFSLEEYSSITQQEEQVLLDYEARLIERERCGFKRHLRECSECRFHRGESRAPSTPLEQGSC